MEQFTALFTTPMLLLWVEFRAMPVCLLPHAIVAMLHQMLLNKGELDGKRYLCAETCKIFTTTTSSSGRGDLVSINRFLRIQKTIHVAVKLHWQFTVIPVIQERVVGSIR
jgi:hypothetical protein